MDNADQELGTGHEPIRYYLFRTDCLFRGWTKFQKHEIPDTPRLLSYEHERNERNELNNPPMRASLLKQNPQMETESRSFPDPASVSGGQIFEPNLIGRSPCACGGGCPTCENERDPDDPTKTGEPSPTALELLKFFKDNRAKFAGYTGPQFRSESHDKDAVIETAQEKVGGTYWTYEFLMNKKTGVVYVKQNQNGVQDINYYQSIVPFTLKEKKKKRLRFTIELQGDTFGEHTSDYRDKKEIDTKLDGIPKVLKPDTEIVIMFSDTQDPIAAKLERERANRMKETLFEKFGITTITIPDTGSAKVGLNGLTILFYGE
jgi:hypothetical protein